MKNGKYELVVAPENYPGKKYRGRYCYEHHLVWWQHTGELPADDEVIHHINGDKRDNTFSNLARLTTVKHNLEHANGRLMCKIQCPSCGKIFYRERKNTHLIKNTKLDFCSRGCIGKFNFKSKTTEEIKEAQRNNILKIFRGSSVGSSGSLLRKWSLVRFQPTELGSIPT